MAELLVCCPIAWALIALATPSNRWRPLVLPLGGITQLAIAVVALQETQLRGFYGWLNLDPLGKIFLGLVSVLFCLCACYAPGYLSQRMERNNRVCCCSVAGGNEVMITFGVLVRTRWWSSSPPSLRPVASRYNTE